MIDDLFVCLGRAGDICIILPSLKRWSDANGKPAAVLTSDEFLPLFEGCSYVRAVSAPCEFRDLKGVLNYLKQSLPQVPVKCLQFYQSGEQKVLPSFWHEQMYLSGLLDGSDEPLVFDRRDGSREGDLMQKWIPDTTDDDALPTILVALDGKSSPFKNREELWQLITDEFAGECNLCDLSDVKAERLYDLLGLYDHAAALISIDTVHLHLSKASKVPVFALARDTTTRWHGTPQQDRFAWYCRYGQVMERAEELIQALRDLLLNKKSPKPEMMKLPKGAYNPSIIIHEGRELISYRYHPDPRNWRTQLVLDGLPVKFPYPVSTCAHEDMRLFEFQGNLWASYVCSRGTRERPRCITGYGQLVRTPEFWAIKEHFQPDMPGNDWSGMQKNMVCWEHRNSIFSLWENGKIIILHREGKGGTVGHFTSEPATWPYGEIRGGTSPLPYKFTAYSKFSKEGIYQHMLEKPTRKKCWLRFFHSRIWPEGKPWRYHIGALIMEPHPPFNVIAVSSKPILNGDESGDPMIPHWKQDCCLPYGAVQDGDEWVVSVGINDAHGALLRLKEGDLNL